MRLGWDEKVVRLNHFFRCSCGKLHTYGGLTSTTVCKCGVRLLRFALGSV